MADPLWDRIIKFIIPLFRKPIGLALILFIFTLSFLQAAQFTKDNIVTPYFYIPLLIIYMGTVYWWIYSRKQMNKAFPSDKYGIIIALQEKDDKRHEELKYNFIEEIQSQLDHDDIWVQSLTYAESRKIIDQKSAEKCAREKGATLIIYGKSNEFDFSTGKREISINLNVILLHRPLIEAAQRELSNQLSELLPAQVKIDRDVLQDGFNITSEWITVYSSYFVGLASIWVQDYSVAQSIFERILLKIRNTNISPLKKLKKLCEQALFDIYIHKCNKSYTQFGLMYKTEFLDESNAFLRKANNLIPNSVQFFVMEAIYQFFKNRDVSKAKQLLNRLSDQNDSKLLSLAFLSGYTGKMSSANMLYKRAFRLKPSDELLREIIRFIQYIIQIEHDKINLFLCLAIVYNRLGNDDESLKNMLLYVELSEEGMTNMIVQELSSKLNTSENRSSHVTVSS